MIGWCTELCAQDGGSGSNSVIHADPSCHTTKGTELVPVRVRDGRILRADGQLVPLPWCAHCRMPEAPGEWAAMAACKGVPQEWFFPDQRWHQYRKAREVCAQCSVLAECRAYTARTMPEYGGWAGTSPRQRKGGILSGCVTMSGTAGSVSR